MKKRQILNGKSSNLKWKVVKSEMSPYQNLNENRHQNLNKLFYDIGRRVSKYVDGLQQIVPAANQLETIRRHRALTQLGQISSVPPESPNSALLPHQAHKKARIVPEPYVCCALSHFCRSLTHALSNSHQPSKRQEYFKLPTRIARC